MTAFSRKLLYICYRNPECLLFVSFQEKKKKLIPGLDYMDLLVRISNKIKLKDKLSTPCLFYIHLGWYHCIRQLHILPYAAKFL